MLVLDLDGTTLDEGRALSPADRDAAHRLRDAGVHVTIATGRLFPGTQWVARELGVEGSVAVLNGNELIDAHSGELVSGHYIAPEVRQQVREVLAAHGLQPFLFGSRHIHFGAESAEHEDYLSIWSPEVTGHDDIFAHPGWTESDDIVALCALGDEEPVEAAAAAIAPLLPDDLGTVLFHSFTGHRFLHLAGARWDKGTALRQLAQDRGIDASEVVAVGDWINDEPMFRTAGRAYAMGHAIDELKAMAHDVLDASRQGGAVAEVARRVWGL
jgi:Cof subfamily protein (haloacid dehalogenase superfamily)